MPKKKTPDPSTFEKLGAFYLGRSFDLVQGKIDDSLMLYDAKDLTTHAVCVGMTGSGKTGLCVSLLEEAAIDGVPAIVIDPKGDLTNLMLTFPDLAPADFRPWIDEGEATRKGMTPDEYADATATTWREGLADWGQDGKRIAQLQDAADFTVYTPGSTAGVPITVLRSFAAPTKALREDAEALGERVSAAVSGLLALIGIEADPVQSKEHILLSTLLTHAWRAGRDLDVATLIAEVQSPPVAQVGVMDMETFFPSKERFQLAMRINNLLASPGFAAWMTGESLDVGRLLWTADGKPRIAILSIAHLSDAERMFFVTLLLTEVIAWMRGQSGTTSLRALLYMDEVFGYLPPTANPPSKTPMLTLLKQARAYGVGVVLATQNPVDLDYKGLSNAGTWFLGRLQTERDKLRVIEGLEGASSAAGAAFDRQEVERILAGLTSRVFLMHNVHEEQPALFHTRWAMSYLRGPMTKVEIERLMAGQGEESAAVAPPSSPATKQAKAAARSGGDRQVLPNDIVQGFAAVRTPAPAGARLLYRPAVSGVADLHYANARAKIDVWQTPECVAPLAERRGAKVWDDATLFSEPLDREDGPRDGATFAPLPKGAGDPKSYTTWEKSLKSHLYKEHPLTLFQSTSPKLVSEPGESEGEFRARLRGAKREDRDRAVEKLRKKYGPKLARLQERIRKAEERIGREEQQFKHQSAQTVISMGATVLGALLGRKVASVGTVGRATTTMRGASRAAREKQDIERAQRDLEARQAELADLEAEFQDEVEALEATDAGGDVELRKQVIRPRKTDLAVRDVGLLWLPWWVDDGGGATKAYE